EELADRLDVGHLGIDRRDAAAELERTGAIGAHRDQDLGDQRDGKRHAHRGIAHHPGAQLREVDVEHHHHEEEQHGDRADIDDDEQHRDERGIGEHHQAGGVEERQDEPQDGMDRVARQDRHGAGGAHNECEQVKGEKLDHGIGWPL
ncbi:hypothetical protein QU38_02890, partial [Staphylococcus aureus]